jgi:ABC-type cobalt transport system substrate-binding protein
MWKRVKGVLLHITRIKARLSLCTSILLHNLQEGQFSNSLRAKCSVRSAFKQNYRPTFSPTFPPFAARISRVVWTWRHLAAEVGTSKPRGGVQGRAISLIGCDASGAYAPGPDKGEEVRLHVMINTMPHDCRQLPLGSLSTV